MKELLRIHLVLFVSAFFFCFVVPCGAQSIPSDLVQMVHTTASQEPCAGACNLTIHLPNTSLSNNLLKLDFSWRYSGAAPTVSNIYCNSDTGHTTWTWTLAKSVLNSGDSTSTFSYYVAGAAAGCNSVTAVASSVWINAEATFKEWREVATSSAVDATGGAVLSGTAPSFAASVTTTVANDLVDQFCTFAPLPGGWPQSSSRATASAGFTALDLEIGYGYGSMAQIDASAGSLTGTIDFVGGASGGDGNCTMVAFKTSPGAGTSPTGVHIVQQNDQTASSNANPKIQAHIFNTNDAVLFYTVSGAPFGSDQFTGFSDSLGNTWTLRGQHDANGTYPMVALTCNAIAGDDLFSPTGGSANDWNIVIVEVSGLKNTGNQACFDVFGKLSADGGSSAVSCSNSMFPGSCYQYIGPTITPTVSNDLVVAMINEGVGPMVSVITSSPGATFNYPLYTGITDGGDMNEGGGLSFFYNSGTNPISFTWLNLTPSTTFVASAIALEAGNTQGTPPAHPTGLQAIVQ